MVPLTMEVHGQYFHRGSIAVRQTSDAKDDAAEIGWRNALGWLARHQVTIGPASRAGFDRSDEPPDAGVVDTNSDLKDRGNRPEEWVAKRIIEEPTTLAPSLVAAARRKPPSNDGFLFSSSVSEALQEVAHARGTSTTVSARPSPTQIA